MVKMSTIKIKSQVRVPVVKAQSLKTVAEQDRALREQIHSEIEKKTKACSNTTYDCTLPRLDMYDYCKRHILQDTRAPYKQCSYFYPTNGKRCLEPAPKYDNKKDYGTNYCFEHSRLSQLTKTKSTIGKFKPVESTETLLHNLAHHVKVDKIKQEKAALKISLHEDDDESDVDVVTPSVDPFVDIDAQTINDAGRIILDYASDSSTDEELTTVGNTWKGYDMDNSDNESVDSQNEDLLKHAGIYTTEEATNITKDKLVRLQALYIDQFQRLQHVLKERRRKYLHSLRRERESLCSIYHQYKDSPKERKLYDKLKALNHYHKKYGVEAILHRKYLEKRAKATEGLVQKPPFHSKCLYTEGGVKCSERTLPCCKFCRKHILEDKKQILFKACGVEKSGVTCQESLAHIFEDSSCVLHIELPPQKSFTKNKYDTESEDDCGEFQDIKKEEQSMEYYENQEIDHEQIVENNITISHEDGDMEVVEEVVTTYNPDEENITIKHD